MIDLKLRPVLRPTCDEAKPETVPELDEELLVDEAVHKEETG